MKYKEWPISDMYALCIESYYVNKGMIRYMCLVVLLWVCSHSFVDV